MFANCSEQLTPNPINNKTGFCLTFDDAYVKEWMKIIDLLDSNNVKATFFVSSIDRISSTDIKSLQYINKVGHEIGSHSWRHIDADKYLNDHTIAEYCEEEINSSVELMKNLGFNPKSFSYPYGHNCDSLDMILLEIFDVLRDVTDEQRKPLEKNINDIDEIYFNLCEKRERVISALGIDENFHISYDMLEEGIIRASENNEVIVFYCHKPVEKINSTYQNEYKYLKNLFALARKHNLKSYTFSELVE